jgi:hypothetical protein
MGIISWSSLSRASKMRRQMLYLTAMRSHRRCLLCLCQVLNCTATFAARRQFYRTSSTSGRPSQPEWPALASSSSMTSSPSMGASSCRNRQVPGWPYFNTPMVWGTKASKRLCTDFVPPSRHKTTARDFIRGCSVCQRHKTDHLHPTGLLQPLDVPTMVW